MFNFKTYRSLISVILLLAASSNFFSQNILHRNNYFIQEYLINPAFTGGKNFNPFYMSYRNQFSQLKERPQVFSASGYYILNSVSNISGSLYSSETPSFQQVFGPILGAFWCRLGPKIDISFQQYYLLYQACP